MKFMLLWRLFHVDESSQPMGNHGKRYDKFVSIFIFVLKPNLPSSQLRSSFSLLISSSFTLLKNVFKHLSWVKQWSQLFSACQSCAICHLLWYFSAVSADICTYSNGSCCLPSSSICPDTLPQGRVDSLAADFFPPQHCGLVYVALWICWL